MLLYSYNISNLAKRLLQCKVKKEGLISLAVEAVAPLCLLLLFRPFVWGHGLVEGFACQQQLKCEAFRILST